MQKQKEKKKEDEEEEEKTHKNCSNYQSGLKMNQ